LEAASHRGDLELPEKGAGDIEQSDLLGRESGLAAYELEPAAVALAQAAGEVPHALELASGGACGGRVRGAALHAELAIGPLDLVYAADLEQAGEEGLGLELELYRTARWELGGTVGLEQGAEALGAGVSAEGEQNAEALEEHAVVTDEVDDLNPRLAWGRAQAAAELLQEYDAGLGGPEHHDAIDRG